MKNIWVGAVAMLALSQSANAADLLMSSGKELYGRLCASCHGPSGAGDGPVGAALKVKPPDLRLLARNNGGKFPKDRVSTIIDGRFLIGAHGTRTMPIWGESFARSELGNPDAERGAQLMVERLTQYLESLQVRPKH